MAKNFEFSILAKFRDLASKGVEGLRKRILGVGSAVGSVRRGPLAALGVGGPVVGMLLGGVSRVAKAFGSLVRVAGRVAGAIVGIFTSMVRAVLGAFRALAGAAGRILAGIPKLLMGATVAVGGLATAFGLLLRSVAMTGDEIAKMARRTGLSVEFLSEMAHVLALSDASLGDLQTAIRGLGRAVEGTMRGAGEYLEIWEALGVSIKDQNGRLKDSEQLFMEVVQALRRVDNATLRLGLAQRVFGRSGERMLAFIDSLTTSLDEQRAAARRLGATWSPEMARMAERAVDAWSKMRTAWRGLKKEFLGPFLEPVAEQLEHLANWLASNRVAVSGWGAQASAWFAAVADVIRQRLGGALEWITTRDWSFENLKAGLKDLASFAQSQLGTLGALFASKKRELRMLVSGSGKMLPMLVPTGWQAGPLLTGLVEGFKWAAGEIEQIFLKLWDKVGSGLNKALVESLRRIAEALRGEAWRVMDKAIERRARALWEDYRTSGAARFRGESGLAWERLSPKDQAMYRQRAGAGMEAKAKGRGMGTLADLLGGVAGALLRADERASRAVTDLSELKAKTDQHGAAAVEGVGQAVDVVETMGERVIQLFSEMALFGKRLGNVERRVKNLGTARG